MLCSILLAVIAALNICGSTGKKCTSCQSCSVQHNVLHQECFCQVRQVYLANRGRVCIQEDPEASQWMCAAGCIRGGATSKSCRALFESHTVLPSRPGANITNGLATPSFSAVRRSLNDLPVHVSRLQHLYVIGDPLSWCARLAVAWPCEKRSVV